MSLATPAHEFNRDSPTKGVHRLRHGWRGFMRYHIMLLRGASRCRDAVRNTRALVISLSIITITLVCSGCTPTGKQQAVGNAVDVDGLPVLTESQQEAGVVCVREPVTGSRISKKVCTNKTQRELDQRKAQDELQNVQRRATGPTIFQ